MRKIILSLFIFAPFFFADSAMALPAFPGAEGMGAATVGGRGGAVYIVDTLSDNPADGMTFREAVQAAGPRIVVFATSGHIRLTSPLLITTPYLTIAGQTSPGGVDVSGQMTVVETHDVIITHMRFRMSSDVCDQIAGNGYGNCETYGDTFRVSGNAPTGDTAAYNVIIDHSSFSWGNDETLDIGGYNSDGVSGSTTDTTVSNSIIAQGLDDPAPENLHGYGILIGSHFQGFRQTSASLHHNYIAHFRMRLPQVSYNGFADIRNNVVYNWAGRGGVLIDEIENSNYHMSDYNLTRLNAVGNHFKKGVLGAAYNCSTNSSGIAYYGPNANDCIAQPAAWARGQFYTSGNTGCANGRVWYGYSSSCSAPTYYPQNWLDQIDGGFLTGSPYETNGIPVITSVMSDSLVDSILSNVGATKPSRDSVDEGFVSDYYNGTGSTLADNHFPDNYPTFPNPSAPTDSDSDGMADTWEQANFGNLSRNGTGDLDEDGYVDLEEYLFVLGGYSSNDIVAPAAPSGLAIF